MKQIKFLSSLLEQDDTPNFTGGTGTTDKPKEKPTSKDKSSNKGSNNTDTKIEPSEDAKADLAEPRASLLKLKGAVGHGKTGVTMKASDGSKSEVWPWAVSWTSSGGEVYNPASKGTVNADKTYYFKTDGEMRVDAHWKKAQDQIAYLYSGTYTIGAGKISITGTEGQAEVIDMATGNITTSNVALVPASEMELNTLKGRFSRIAPNFSWYFYMRMFNLQSENPGLRKAILDALIAANYNPFAYAGKPGNVIDTQMMAVNTAFFKSTEFGYWPVTRKFYSQFAAGQSEVTFGSITDIDSPVKVPVKSGKTDFTSGYEYLAYKLEGAARDSSAVGSSEHGKNSDSDGVNTVFSDDEALAFYTILAGLSQPVVNKLNTMAKDGAYAGLLNGSWSQTVLDEVGFDIGKNAEYKDVYDKYISKLAINSGKSFTQESMLSIYANIENTNDAKWFKSASELYALGGTYLQDALKAVPKYVAPKAEPLYIK